MSFVGLDGHTVEVSQSKERPMVIVAGYLVVEPMQRDGYLNDCRAVVRQARESPGCLDFAISADLIERDRIHIFERWNSRVALDDFRGSGPSDEQQGLIVRASVREYDVGSEQRLT
jgi:quinol monooxygenase YgiN